MTFFCDRFFPIVKNENKNYKYKAVVGIGGNKGDMRKRFRNLYMYLLKCPLISISETSSILKNPPFGYLEQDDFYNAIIVLRTSMSAKAFLKFLLHVEKIFKRERSFKNAPRTLDLDIIFFNNMQIRSKNLVIPHPKWFERESVVLPLLNLKRKI
ncbi:2-amino-4-hydroxy-6-hydroxymethyldihydropteridine diphosphokinase [Sulfurospirillum arcachonense]|uniref:2-amino-4-hydroxy-6- hydroxymethyldihydropteridine diphosphokinase n=1 Tax=Sulfurospirillum arcachonense TaxID=57666 RepID=UPI00046894B3|nr:2-amino-4-hydroxy-6-hydroxymethyldihydropteridine diphosphokinase [Sulfurospirillum arcachonense]